MLNIEVYGLRQTGGYIVMHDSIIVARAKAEANAKPRDLIDEIIEAFEGLLWADKVVVTVIDSIAINKEFTNLPFLRICSTNMEEINALISKLEPLGYDIEILLLTGFASAKVGKIHGK